MVSKISMDILISIHPGLRLDMFPATTWGCKYNFWDTTNTTDPMQTRSGFLFFLMDVNLQHTCWLVGGVKQKTSGCYIVFSAHRYNTSLYTFQCQGKANFWSVSRFQTIPTPAFPRCPNKDSLEFWSVHPGETVIPAAFVSMSGPL